MKQVAKRTKSIFGILTIILLAGLTACNSPSKQVESAEEDVSEAKEELRQAEEDYKIELANFKRESNQQIIENETAIAKFKAQMATSKKELKASYEMQIAAFEQKNAEMKLRMEAYEEDGMDKWQSFKTEFNHDMDELGKSLNDFTIDNK